MWWGNIFGFIGEILKLFILLGVLFLIFIKVVDWCIMVLVIVGFVVCGLMINGIVLDIFGFEIDGIFKFMVVFWYYYFYMGSFFFVMVFMVIDLVIVVFIFMGKWIYGFFIGFVGLIICIFNFVYLEGWMLVILFMNVFVLFIDYYVFEVNVKCCVKCQVVIVSVCGEVVIV